MRRLLVGLCAVCTFIPALPASAADAITRRDGFLQLWETIRRPALESREKPYSDVQKGAKGFLEITYAKSRSILDEAESFGPDEQLLLPDALLWLFRTRNIDDDRLFPDALPGGQDPYGLIDIARAKGLGELFEPAASAVPLRAVTAEELLSLIQTLDTFLTQEDHEVSLYSEKFHGKGTAFGEKFDMWAMTAAHRTFPSNTLVKVTNLENGKSVIVRINDRGPYVRGRDLDLSLGAFTSIAPRSRGKIRATFERLGDAFLMTPANPCALDAVQMRIGPAVRLTKGVPQALHLGKTLTLASQSPFVVAKVTYPDGTSLSLQDWVLPGEEYAITPSMEGVYRFMLGTKEGRKREMTANVVQCG